MHDLIWEDLLTTKDIESISGLIVHFYKLFYILLQYLNFILGMFFLK